MSEQPVLPHLLAGALFSLLLGAAALSDLRTRTIPNALTSALAATGIAVALFGVTAVAPQSALVAGGSALMLGATAQVLRLLGGGDIKLFAAMACWLGTAGTLRALPVVAVVGGMVALPALIRRRAHPGPLSLQLPQDHTLDVRHVPYGVAICLGGLWTWWIEFAAGSGAR